MGYQPGLDGLRALSVVTIMLYHAGFSWMHGGFFAVDVFFAASGFLITTLLLEEVSRTRRVSLREFWVRRARRLLPALGVLLATVAVVTLFAGTDQQIATFRRDLPWAAGYLSNWGQITGEVPYWAADPPLLRHLWTLAIEEQFYLLWPLAFLGLRRLRSTHAALVLLGLTVVTWVVTFVVHAGSPALMGGWFEGADRTNFAYLSTVTRAGTLLLGGAAAFVWQPWRTVGRMRRAERARLGTTLDRVGGLAVGLFAAVSLTAVITAGYVYQWLLPLMGVVATLLVLIIVHPAARGMRRLLGWRPLVEIGKRSYGLYLWHWPIFVFAGAIGGDGGRFLVAMSVAALASEISYRYVEMPFRAGQFGTWWRQSGDQGRRWFLGVTAVVALAVTVAYVRFQPADVAVGGEQGTFSAPTSTLAGAVAPTVDSVTASGGVAPTIAAAAPGPLRVTIVGDSQGHSLAVNQPRGLGETIDVSNGSLPGCSVYDVGSIRTTRQGMRNNFAMCDGWAQQWADAAVANDAEVTLVVLGAWDVFDLDTGDGTVLTFGTPAWDRYVGGQLQTGLDALAATGTKIALLEAACMRPQDVDGAAVPALPERRDDTRVAHVNQLLQQAAATNAATTTFVEGPDEWCGDDTVSSSLANRWDGVHVFGPGAAMIYDAIADQLLALRA
ncbi:MAG: acyltransferase family protein [Desertimonas sp.]